MWTRRALDQAKRCIAHRTLPGIGEMFHPCGSCLGFIAGLNEVLQRFTQMFGDLQTSSRPRVINALQVDHACFHSTTLGRMGIPLTWPPVQNTEFDRSAFGDQGQQA